MIRPVLDRLIVQKDESETRTIGGLFIPDSAQKRSLYATVVAVGPGRDLPQGGRRAVDVKVGDRILYHPDAGWDLPGERLMMLEEKDVIGVCE